MKLKTRLSVTFLSIFVIPVCLSVIALLGMSIYHIHTIEKLYSVDSKGLELILDPISFFASLTYEVYEQIEEVARTHPAKLESRKYLEEINNKLVKTSSYLVVEKNNLPVFGENKDWMRMGELLPDSRWKHFYRLHRDSDSGMYMNAKAETLVKEISFLYGEGDNGKVYIITSLGKNIFHLRRMIVGGIMVFLISLIAAGLIFGRRLYMDISVPLSKIKDAARDIKEGNLDLVMDVKGIDEMTELCKDFEAVRSRLKSQAEEKIKYDSESKELISNISHDLKTPITAVKGYVEGIIDGVADTPEKMEKYIKTIYNKANEMDRLINELTFYSKIDTNRIPYTFTKLNVADYFNDCIDEVGLDLESKNIELSYFDYVPADTQIIGDAEQLKRVINNIVGNSIKYMDKEKGYINIRIKDMGDFIQVEIEDNGRGIGEKDLPYIFDRFYRTDASRNSAKGGSGIGLSIVKKIIEDHGGRIWATSKESTGTVMYFMLRKYQEVQMYE